MYTTCIPHLVDIGLFYNKLWLSMGGYELDRCTSPNIFFHLPHYFYQNPALIYISLPSSKISL
jgi:hypothetical protein